MTATNDNHIGKLETQLQQWGAKLDELVAKADEVGAETKAEYRQAIDELGKKYQTAQAKLAELKTAGGTKWELFKNGIEHAWSDVETAFKGLKS